jgi:hypothetical protein
LGPAKLEDAQAIREGKLKQHKSLKLTEIIILESRILLW